MNIQTNTALWYLIIYIEIKTVGKNPGFSPTPFPFMTIKNSRASPKSIQLNYSLQGLNAKIKM